VAGKRTACAAAKRANSSRASAGLFVANLTLLTKNEGQVNEAGKKGWISRALDTVFAF